MNKLIFLLLCSFCTSQRWHYPPPKVLLSKHDRCSKHRPMSEDPTINCHGGVFTLSMGYYIPCRAHYHCYGSREPPNWCMSQRNYTWTQWGCHCDMKIGSCIVERSQDKNERLEWSYCVPNNEFYCATKV